MILEKLAKYLRADVRMGWNPWVDVRDGQGLSIYQGAASVAMYAKKQGITYRTVTILRHDMQLKQNLAPLVAACITQFCAPFPAGGPPSTKIWPFGLKSRGPDTWQTLPWKLCICFLDFLEKNHGDWPFEMIAR